MFRAIRKQRSPTDVALYSSQWMVGFSCRFFLLTPKIWLPKENLTTKKKPKISIFLFWKFQKKKKFKKNRSSNEIQKSGGYLK